MDKGAKMRKGAMCRKSQKIKNVLLKGRYMKKNPH